MRRQLVTVALATTLTVAIAFVVPLALLVRTLAAERALDEGERIARTLIPVIVSGDAEAQALTVEQLRAASDATISVYPPDGGILGARVEDATVATARAGTSLTRTAPDGARVTLTPVVSQAGGTSVIRVAIAPESLTAGVTTAWSTLGLVGLALVAIAVLIADRLARRAVTEATDVAAAARRLAAGDRTARAPAGDTPELADAARALNTLAGRIDTLIAGEREAAADLSHRLRTPMTALRLDVDALPASNASDRVAQDVAQLELAVDRAIRSARGAAAGAEEATGDAVKVVRERSEFWGALAQDEGRPWRCTGDAGPLPVRVDHDQLATALDALLGNVLSHTDPPAGCHVSVVAAGADVRIRIDDDGPGFDATATARGHSGGGSTGLGLDIARRTAERAGGSLRIGGRDDGGRVELLLPGA